MKYTKTLLMLSVLFLAGCSTNTIHVDALQGVLGPVLERHDTYIGKDAKLSDVERRAFLRSSEMLRAVVKAASE